MTPTLFLSLSLFTLAMSITPGPNNIMLTASGLRFGFRSTIPHMLGISAGVMLMVLAIGLGLGALFAAVPALYPVLKYAGAAYLLYLAWRILQAGAPAQQAGRARPFTFLQAAAFQWVNPKAWIMVIGAIATYLPEQGFFGNLLLLMLTFGIINLPSIAVWAYAGTLLRNLLRTPRAVQIFNTGMAILLVASLYPTVVGTPG